jgi:transcription antitermination protein NusB
MQALFQLDKSADDVRNVLESRSDEETLDATDVDYLENITREVIANRDQIDDVIRRYSIDLDISRLGRVERAILRLAIGEILYAKDIPVSVAINEAVKLAKKFGSEQAAKFINGVLGKLSREHGGGPEDPKSPPTNEDC